MYKTKFMEEMIKMLTFKRMKFQPKTKVLGKNIKIKIKTSIQDVFGHYPGSVAY